MLSSLAVWLAQHLLYQLYLCTWAINDWLIDWLVETTWTHGSCSKADDNSNEDRDDAADNGIKHERQRVEPVDSVPGYAHRDRPDTAHLYIHVMINTGRCNKTVIIKTRKFRQQYVRYTTTSEIINAISLLHKKLKWWSTTWWKEFENHFNTIPACDGQTDGQTSCSTVRARYAYVVKLFSQYSSCSLHNTAQYFWTQSQQADCSSKLLTPNLFMPTLKLQQRTTTQQYGDWYTGVGGWAVTFDTARRGLGGDAARPGPSSLYQI